MTIVVALAGCSSKHPTLPPLAADDVIVNDGNLDGLIRQVDTLHNRYIEMVGRQSDKAK